MNILMLADNIEYGGSIYIRDAINKYTDYSCYLCVYKDAPYSDRTDGVISIKNVNDVNKILAKPNLTVFIFDVHGLMMYLGHFPMLRPLWHIVFFSGTLFLRTHKKTNDIIDGIKNKTVFAMLDLIKYTSDSHPLLQPCGFTYNEDKYDEFTVCHSPGS